MDGVIVFSVRTVPTSSADKRHSYRSEITSTRPSYHADFERLAFDEMRASDGFLVWCLRTWSLNVPGASAVEVLFSLPTRIHSGHLSLSSNNSFDYDYGRNKERQSPGFSRESVQYKKRTVKTVWPPFDMWVLVLVMRRLWTNALNSL